MIDPLAAVHRLVDRLPELGTDGTALADALGRWLEGDVTTLDQALGLFGDWRREARRRRRDDLIRELAGHYPGSRWARAEAIAEELRRYAGTGWRHDQRVDRLPETAPERRQLMHAILTVDPDAPTTARRISDLLKPERVAISETPVRRPEHGPKDEDFDERAPAA